MQPTPHDPSMYQGVRPAAPRELPTALRVLIVAMGACAPGGLLFMLALIFAENIHLEKPVWFILAAFGGIGGYFLQRNLAPR